MKNYMKTIISTIQYWVESKLPKKLSDLENDLPTTSWNDLEDKPFYEVLGDELFTATVIRNDDMPTKIRYYGTPEDAQLSYDIRMNNPEAVLSVDGKKYEVGSGEYKTCYYYNGEVVLECDDEYGLNLKPQALGLDDTIPSYEFTLYKPNKVKTLEPKFLPEHLQFGETPGDELTTFTLDRQSPEFFKYWTYDTTICGEIVDIFDNYPEIVLSINGENYNVETDNQSYGDNRYYCYNGEEVLLGSFSQDVIELYLQPLGLEDDGAESCKITLYEPSVIKRIDPKFLQLTIGKHGTGEGAEIFNYEYNDARGDYSHAEGYQTKADNAYMSVSGKYNTNDSPKYEMYRYATTSANTYSMYYYSNEYEITEDMKFKLVNPTNGYTNDIQVLGMYTLSVNDAQATSDSLYIVEQSSRYSSGYARITYKLRVFDSTKTGKYVHIVGNGTADDARSNAHTLDWEGNAEFQGDVIAYGCDSPNGESISLKAVAEKALAPTSWNELEDKPFYDSRKEIGWEYSFDGNIEGKEYLDFDGTGTQLLIKVSNHTVPKENIIGATMKFVEGEQEETIILDEGHCQEVNENLYSAYLSFICYGNTDFNGMTLTKGIYFVCMPQTMWISYLGNSTIDGELKQLDEKYLPNNIQSDWNQNDETQLDYIKNRPFYSKFNEHLKYAMPRNGSSTSYVIDLEDTSLWDFLNANETIDIQVKDGEYKLEKSSSSTTSVIYYVSSKNKKTVLEHFTDKLFFYPTILGIEVPNAITEETKTIDISFGITDVIQLDEKYLPSPTFIVTVTKNEDGTYSADHYYDDIVAAFNEGKIITALCSGTEYPFKFYVDGYAAYFQGEVYGVNGLVTSVQIEVTNNSVNFTQTKISLQTKSDNTLTTTDKTIVGAINEVNEGIIKVPEYTLSYNNVLIDISKLDEMQLYHIPMSLASSSSMLYFYITADDDTKKIILTTSTITGTGVNTFYVRIQTNSIKLHVSALNANYYVNTSDTSTANNITFSTENIYLTKNNVEEYTPTGSYNPATKKYVDDEVANLLTEINNLKAEIATLKGE